MSIFYDPTTRKPKPLVIVIVILTPILVGIFVYIITKNIANKLNEKNKKETKTADIF